MHRAGGHLHPRSCARCSTGVSSRDVDYRLENLVWTNVQLVAAAAAVQGYVPARVQGLRRAGIVVVLFPINF